MDKLDKIRLFEKLNQIEKLDHVRRIETKINDIKPGLLTRLDIREIICGYKTYPLYMIKYVCTVFPKISSFEALDYIVKSKERQCDLMECILTSYSIGLCDLPDIRFGCHIIRAYRETETVDADADADIDIDVDIDVEDLRNQTDNNKTENYTGSRIIKKNCSCFDKRHWYSLYDCFMELISSDPRFMFDSYNVNHSITTLVSKTDVTDQRLSDLFKKAVRNPDRWRSILIFIKKTGLVSSAYGDIIFFIRDTIIKNDRAIEKHQAVSKFNDRVLLSNLLKRHSECHSNMSMITNNIYITDINGARNTDLIKDKRISCVVSLTKQPVFRASNIKYFHIKIDDTESVNFLSMTVDVADQVIELITQNSIVLVHCFLGVSRSVSFVILVLIKQGMEFDDALKLVTTKRPAANPNPSFKKQLKDFSNSRK